MIHKKESNIQGFALMYNSDWYKQFLPFYKLLDSLPHWNKKKADKLPKLTLKQKCNSSITNLSISSNQIILIYPK